MPHIQRHIAGHPGTYACLSTAAAVDTLVVYVHGFWGGAASTWEQVASLMDTVRPQRDTADTRDFIFYDYKTRADTVSGHADTFLKFLVRTYPTVDAALLSTPRHANGAVGAAIENMARSLFSRPQRTPTALQRTGRLSYSKLILVGHSLGGVIVRRALLTALASSQAQRFDAASLRLFAPAHAGFRQKDALGAALSAAPVAGLAFALFALGNRAFNDLQPGSPVLMALERDHKSLADHPQRRATVVWAQNDYVVFDVILEGDDEERVAGKNHRSVCKTKSRYLLPLDVVLR